MEEEPNPIPNSHEYSHRSWAKKFQVAFIGLGSGVIGRRESRNLNSFAVHIPMAVVVVIAGIALGVSWNSMALLVLCIGLVIVTELINSSLELLAKAVTDQPDEHVGAALDVASGAVLMASLISAAVGAIVLGARVTQLMGW